ncbi:MAG: hypothetical protein GYB49_01925 [Alphaproteobacteria bacterium]|nr:hypothetical protein [Alphaproteobacteria bacterium]|tara:strand:- start:3909 stop:5339 length:1431 start_codon:yes stop_codon:yes gene_type:complete
MDCRPTKIDPWAQIFLVAPYWTSITVPATSPEARPQFLEKLQGALNKGAEGAPWELERFARPRTIRFRKYGQLVCPFEFKPDFVEEIQNHIGTDHFDGLSGRINYFDYGIGNIEICIGIKNITAESLEVLTPKFEVCKLRVVDELVAGVPSALIDLEDIDRRISAYLKKHCDGLENRLKPSYDQDIISKRSSMMCGPVSRNVLFINSDTPSASVEVPLDAIQQLAAKFLNQVNGNLGQTGSSSIPVSHVGFEGAVAVVNRNETSCQRVGKSLSDGAFTVMNDLTGEEGEVKRTKMLWALVHMYWSAFYCSSEGLFSLLASHSEKKKARLADIRREYEALEFYKRIISTLKFEAKPEKVVVEGEDRIRYTSVWDAYESDDLLISLEKINADLTENLLTLRDRAHRIIQNRTATLIAIFTALTIFSLVADVIELYDVTGLIKPLLRMTILFSGAVLLLMVAYLVSHITSVLTSRIRRH